MRDEACALQLDGAQPSRERKTPPPWPPLGPATRHWVATTLAPKAKGFTGTAP